ncbi:MAG: hypothetical protein A2700_00345 [Candidatus Blackburnbacteria bacterium RIFCSPHIGHO2_01_FULL_44_64]|uniref:SCP domain-containing protein n=1 Tax=Candidatus Blackburnbacteria bacterium RIFCSPHIGHO2_02_FULL_44_20 TaxID=1797516 RepID=A0A1G1V7C7_9BACT|nr:MAG: hypothetical protein A2700_00345 [Candidatus Blackburnbacteria bacterium RIFCSPHIGHO2_01_FULL_44_64]OGY10227.1 MAG: hypothetical protein A3E16_03390 [Candidatus Blackburnbacteria bacterium RIFCSPHIGHO2_12_FULL_44_25]OGY11368.1 MAG: hypothetical protein A3D26_02585 [Candidatus Blackburnbacteria bacterium RIFCSPHIGHO2_02_FULL_44_20]OGY13544.1 MAG: hypothetical protein A3A62_01010 [Candidatus Blackburnbacteria bacterium RIFCSPLOWO2_01_FULL_44_43]
MAKLKLPKVLKFKPKYFFNPLTIALVLVIGFIGGYLAGLDQAVEIAQYREQKLRDSFLEALQSSPKTTPTPSVVSKKSAPQPTTSYLQPTFTGPELWEAINKARVQHGVNSLNQRDILCTVAAIRLSQIRQLGKLDGHDGFQGVYDKYKDDPTMPNNVSEFLISGYPTPDQAVAAWLDTLGHKKLITGGEYIWGCVYAQDGFGVAITGF